MVQHNVLKQIVRTEDPGLLGCGLSERAATFHAWLLPRQISSSRRAIRSSSASVAASDVASTSFANEPTHTARYSDTSKNSSRAKRGCFVKSKSSRTGGLNYDLSDSIASSEDGACKKSPSKSSELR